MKLERLLHGIEYQFVAGSLEQIVHGIAYDSRQVKEGDAFICIPGFTSDGHHFAEEAQNRKARVIIAEREVNILPGNALILVDEARKALGLIASNFYQKPSQAFKLLGVTGTNGKTTTTHLIKAILEKDRNKVGIMGTLYAKMDDYEVMYNHTTPESLEIERFFHYLREKAADYAIIEVSSHALSLGRVDRLCFDAAVFTNLSQDHLDFHASMEEYQEAKLKLFQMVARKNDAYSIINQDDPRASQFIRAAGNNVYTYGILHAADVKAEQVTTSRQGSSFIVRTPHYTFAVQLNLVGMFSIYNALAAISLALKQGVQPEVIVTALQEVQGIPGRFEKVDGGQDFTVIVDYAHTPDGLKNILKTGRELTEKRLITIFGCGGDRDKGKRPQMGQIAARYSDFCIVTSDNPRSEKPEAIIDDIIQGIKVVPCASYTIIPNRKEAIEYGLQMALAGDLVIIAGKGHETYQIVQDQIMEFDDRRVAKEALQARKGMDL